MIEDYAIRINNFRMVPTGNFEITNRGTKKDILEGASFYTTALGEFPQKQWKEAALAEIEKCGELGTLERVRSHVRENCAWLQKESEIEEYAIECHCNRAYLHWPEWREDTGNTIIWM